TVLRAVSFGQTTSSAKALALKSNAVMTINANFFDENGKPLGLVVSQGIQQQKIHQGGNTLTGVFFVTRENIGIVNRSNFQSDLVIEAVQAGPRLLASGNKIKGLNKNEIRTRRSGVCVDKKKRLIFFITTGFMGITLHQLQEMILTPDIGCVDALNLDGGGSAQMYLDTQHASGQSKIDNITIHGSEPVPVMLALRQR
ncbi:MAG: phosphodiester glycosidase family protein, partial [Bdellovibrionales bacterium]|nr:phosphodiester glycosidase family protein [Bdellovibrionales bacterium]